MFWVVSANTGVSTEAWTRPQLMARVISYAYPYGTSWLVKEYSFACVSALNQFWYLFAIPSNSRQLTPTKENKTTCLYTYSSSFFADPRRRSPMCGQTSRLHCSWGHREYCMHGKDKLHLACWWFRWVDIPTAIGVLSELCVQSAGAIVTPFLPRLVAVVIASQGICMNLV